MGAPIFQSTHPARGATKGLLNVARKAHHFNPRTPRGVRLPYHPDHQRRLWRFQSTHPARGATHRGWRCQRRRTISIHAPREGCDLQLVRVVLERGISIHAPREGCDDSRRVTLRSDSPFQSTHPARGATSPLIYLGTRDGGFQSTHPARGATYGPPGAPLRPLISIHAPREGCDSKLYQRAESLLGSICLFAQGEEG